MVGQPAFRPVPEPMSHPLSTSSVGEHLVLLREPHSQVTESYRSLRAKLQVPLARGLQAFCLVSAWGRDGKSTVALNLAHSLSQLFHDVVLVDCDLRKPTLTRLFELEGRPGLSDLLAEGGDPAACLHPTPADRMSFLPAGTRLDNPADLLHRGHLSRVFEWLRSNDRIVVVDTSPVEACSDALLLGPTVGAALMVVNAVQWEGEVEQRLKKSLLEHRFDILGVVLNGVAQVDSRKTYGYGPKPTRKGFWARFSRSRKS